MTVTTIYLAKFLFKKSLVKGKETLITKKRFLVIVYV